MPFPPPSQRQARILWGAVTALAVAVVLMLIGVLCWGMGWVLQRLSPVILPLAVAGILAYLLDPLVDLFERRMARQWAISLVFFIAVLFVAGLVATVVPQLIAEAKALTEQFTIPTNRAAWQERFWNWFSNNALTVRAQKVWASELGQKWTADISKQIQDWLATIVPTMSAWLWSQATRVASWFGLIVGMALVPVYCFYFLLEEEGIKRSWTDYLPVKESKIKDEIVFVLSSINNYLILFFRGQVLVALCDGVLLTIGFVAIGLDYALILGFAAGILTIVPFLGVVISLVPALIIAVIQFGDWLHPILVLGIFGLVQLLEGLVISPKIMGDRVGLHPLTIIIAVMVGTTLMGGIIGGILAIPLTAALRVLMFRYVWKGRPTAS